MSIAKLHNLYVDYLHQNAFSGAPNNLYEPMRYIMELGGKRIRPILCMTGAEACGSEAEHAIAVAHAMEVFHNFSLVHDDIMDRADQRRGLPTVHKKWNEPTAILAGDNLLVKAYESILAFQGEGKDAILRLFSRTAAQVCEGQQDDMDFAERNEVSEAEYLQMIQNKTAVLLGCSLASGALVANAEDKIVQGLYDFAIAIGMSFQMMDDYLDAFGDASKTGKVSGGDIMEGKKTWLYIKSCEINAETPSWFAQYEHEQRVIAVKSQWINMGLDQLILQKAREYNQEGLRILSALAEQGVKTDGLTEILDFLSGRSH
ncbi:MAG: polyprenyl synthetase family protein [Bacteroidota bacterium]|jgi:geranylgeranyl diphosphate synthase type II